MQQEEYPRGWEGTQLSPSPELLSPAQTSCLFPSPEREKNIETETKDHFLGQN